MRLLQQEFATGEMGFTMSICAAAIRQAECLKGVKIGRTRIEQMSSAVHPITDIRRCYLARCQPGGQPYFFFKQLANRHDAHAAIIPFLPEL